MFDDIVICELNHTDPNNQEYCNPQEIVVGTSNDEGFLVSMLFRNEAKRKSQYSVNKEVPLGITIDILNNDEHSEFKDKYDIQTGAIISINDKKSESYKMLIGSSGQNFIYFSNVPSVNNTTDFGDTIYLNFPHPVESFMYKDSLYKQFS